MRSLSKTYPVWLCDVWGVIHNGEQAFASPQKALLEHRQNGGIVLFVTNAPRRANAVAEQLDSLGVARSCYDAIITSGDVTRSLITEHGKGAVHHLGPKRDAGIFDGLSTRLVPLSRAHAVVCTGLFDDAHETAETYDGTYAQMKSLGLPMICANPDKIVRRGSKIIYCAGALAERYENLGGTVMMAGKPFRPIYDLALKTAADIRKQSIAKRDVLAIGDGPETDIGGAASYGIDCVLITGGISDDTLPPEKVAQEVRAMVPGARIVLVQQLLRW